MTYTFKLSRRLAISNFPVMMLSSLLVLCACTGSDINEPSAIELARGGIKGRPAKVGDSVLVVLSINPKTDTLQPSESRAFSAKGVRKNGDTVDVAATWTATGGHISSTGEYLAGSAPGHFRVIGTYGSAALADTSDVIISSNEGSTLSAIVLTPGQVSLSARATQQFAAMGLMSDGSSTPLDITYSATGGTITNGGLYTAGETPGAFQVIATQSNGVLADTAVVEIAEPVPTLVQVVLKPSSASLLAGATQQFSAYGIMSNGDSVPVSASYSASGGAINTAGLYTAGTLAGTFRAIAAASGRADTSVITISLPAPTPPPVSDSDNCPTSGYLRLVNVSSVAGLTSALTNAMPGDQIRLAPGTYLGNFSIARDGTRDNPITLCGPEGWGATIQNSQGWFTVRGDWWVIRGIRFLNGEYALNFVDANHNVFEHNLVEELRQEGLVLQGAAGSSYNEIRYNTIRRTGRVTTTYGEGIYVGSGKTYSDPSNYNVIEYNTFGPGVTAEHVELKPGTSGNLVRGNKSDAAGHLFEYGAVGGVYAIAGMNQTVEDNEVFNLNQSGTSAFWFFKVNGAVVHRNAASGPSMSWGFRVSESTNVKLYCDNSGSKNVACTP